MDIIYLGIHVRQPLFVWRRFLSKEAAFICASPGKEYAIPNSNSLCTLPEPFRNPSTNPRQTPPEPISSKTAKLSYSSSDRFPLEPTGEISKYSSSANGSMTSYPHVAPSPAPPPGPASSAVWLLPPVRLRLRPKASATLAKNAPAAFGVRRSREELSAY